MPDARVCAALKLLDVFLSNHLKHAMEETLIEFWSELQVAKQVCIVIDGLIDVELMALAECRAFRSVAGHNFAACVVKEAAGVIRVWHLGVVKVGHSAWFCMPGWLNVFRHDKMNVKKYNID